jgi:hypothetical protein
MRYFFQMAAAAAVLSLSQVHGSLFDGNGSDSFVNGNDTQWYVEADFLWWKAVEDSLPVAVVVDTTTGVGGSDSSAHVLNPNHKWDPGFRIGLGYQPCGCDWDFYASWTHFDTKAKRSVGPGSATETIYPQFGSLTPFAANLATLSSNWHLHLNWADFELNKSFCVSPCFKFGVHAGLRGLWINQKLNFSLTNAATTPVTNSLNSKSNYSSVGVVAGIDASWLFGCGLSVNASAGGAILYGRQNSHVSESIVALATTDTVNGSSHYNISRAMTDLRLGLGYEGCVCDKTFLLKADWEHHILFCQNQFPRGSATSNSRPRDGDLTIQGVTFSASLLF